MQPELAHLLAEASIDLAAILTRGGSAWMFGSRATRCARADSDWDILIVGSERGLAHELPRRSRLDLVYVDTQDFSMWCGSELASHVAVYGRPISVAHKIIARPTEAAPRKQRVVQERAASLARLWILLQPAQREREVLRLRRDAQRAWHLTMSLAVPPTAMLDEQWSALDASSRCAILDFCGLYSVTRAPAAKIVRAIFESAAQ
jgi:hypothetical protein